MQLLQKKISLISRRSAFPQCLSASAWRNPRARSPMAAAFSMHFPFRKVMPVLRVGRVHEAVQPAPPAQPADLALAAEERQKCLRLFSRNWKQTERRVMRLLTRHEAACGEEPDIAALLQREGIRRCARHAEGCGMKRNDLVIGSRGAAEKPGEQSAGRHGQHHLASRFEGFSQRKRVPHEGQNFGGFAGSFGSQPQEAQRTG